MKQASELQYAFLAGIIEGEGCIYIGSHSSNKETGARYFTTAIQVTNTDKNLIDYLHNTFGGLQAPYTAAQTPKIKRKPVFVWKVTGEELTHICKRVLPYMIAKKNQIEVMLEMRKTYETHPSQREKIKKNGVQPLSDTLINLRYSLMHKLRSLRNEKLILAPCCPSALSSEEFQVN